jgi:N-acetylmuramoyl-L-alanine amidase CwlA
MQMKKQLIKDTPYKFGKKNKKKFITIHETDNFKEKAHAQAHANLQSNGNAREASWHYQVDDKESIQSFLHDFQLWHGGDGKKGNGNLNSIAIEICVNADGDYKKAVNNAAKLVKEIMKQENIPIENVVQHNKWSGKNCPRFLRSGEKGIDWNDFINLIKKEDKPVAQPIVKIETGGLTNNDLIAAINYFREKGWYGKITVHWEKGNPKLLSGGLTPNMRKDYEAWLKEQNWWYRVTK